MSVRCPTCNRRLDLDEIRADQFVTCFIDRNASGSPQHWLAAQGMPQHWLTTFRFDGSHSRGVGLKSTKLKKT